MIVKQLAFQHPHSSAPVFEAVSLEAHAGAILAIFGPNGSGKTTLFKCIAGLWKPQQGEILFDGHNLLKLSGPQRARRVAVVPQEHEPPFPYTVAEVVLMGRAVHIPAYAAPGRKDREIVEEAIQAVGITSLRDHAYTRISGGERQLALVARALAQQTPILLLDEPTSHLDFRNQLHVLKMVRQIARQRRLTVLMTLHDPNLALLFADQVAVLNQGSIQARGPAREVITENMLSQVYGVEVDILNHNGTSVVAPKVQA